MFEKLKNLGHEKEFDTKTLVQDLKDPSENANDGKKGNEDGGFEEKSELDALLEEDDGPDINPKITRIYEPEPLNPNDDRYKDIMEQFASAPTKPKYYYEEMGAYWSCSCGHINKGDYCKNCGLERSLLRSLFILHKPASEPGQLGKKLSRSKKQADLEDEQQTERDRRKKAMEDVPDEELKVVPIETAEETPEETYIEEANEKEAPPAEETLPVKNEENLPAVTEPPLPPVPVKKKMDRRLKAGLIAAVVIIVLAAGGYAAYHYLAAPAILYDEAQQLQADGEYEKAIAKYESLGDYKDSADLIWKCHISIADELFLAEKYQEAMDAYEECIEIKDSDELREKIDKCKFGYVQANRSKRSDTVEKYMADLMKISYPGIREIYDAYYEWHFSIIANTSEDDYKTDEKEASRRDTVFFHVALSGGEPGEKIQLYYEVTWPNGSTDIQDLESSWKSGSNITARFQYPIPIFGAEGKLTFKLYDKSSNRLLGSDSIEFED